jgi:hypothetical protein
LSCGIAGSVIALGYVSLSRVIATRIAVMGRTPRQADGYTGETSESLALPG